MWKLTQNCFDIQSSSFFPFFYYLRKKKNKQKASSFYNIIDMGIYTEYVQVIDRLSQIGHAFTF